MINFEKITSYWEEDRRITYIPQSFSSVTSPLTKILPITNEGIQKIIKSRISRENMILFLSKKMNEDSIEDYRKLFEDSFFDSYLLLSSTPRKYLFDLILAVLFEELLSFNQVKDILQDKKDGAVSIFEKMIVLEYNLFTYKESILNTNFLFKTKFTSKKYVMNYISTILHGVPGIKSYKDIANLESELFSIFDPLIKSTISPAYPNSALFSFRRIIKDDSFDFKSVVRINKAEAYIEKDEISRYSFFLNFNREKASDSYNLEHSRKFHALKIDEEDSNKTQGFYYKEGSNSPIFFNDIRGYSYYPLLRENSISTSNIEQDIMKAYIFLKKYGEQIIERTINY
jgi:hypothetical protein